MSSSRASYYSNDNADGSQSPGSHSLSGRRLARQNSFAVMRDSVLWLGEQAQTQFLDRNLDAHHNVDDTGSFSGSTGRLLQSSPSIPRIVAPSSYNSLDFADQKHTIRFQVIVWNIGRLDVKNASIEIKFRVTMFWNDPGEEKVEMRNSGSNFNDTNGGKSKNNDEKGNPRRKKRSQSIWVMSGRSSAYKKQISENEVEVIDVPPISILNANSFEVIGAPEVQLLRKDVRLLRWSCMYRAQLVQDEIRVSAFPHDSHVLALKLGILSQRHVGGRWDRRKWKLALASESDTQGSIRIPYGVVVDHVKVPEFEMDKSGLDFELASLRHGSALRSLKDQDFYLKVKLKVQRESGYYDKNVMPLLNVLNLVSISILTLDSSNYFQRGLMSLNIAFVEVGFRMTFDSHLPSVGYQIKMQRILNFFFYSILSVVLESSVLKFLVENEICSISFTRQIDLVMALILLCNQAYLSLVYTSFDRLRQSANGAPEETDGW